MRSNLDERITKVSVDLFSGGQVVINSIKCECFCGFFILRIVRNRLKTTLQRRGIKMYDILKDTNQPTTVVLGTLSFLADDVNHGQMSLNESLIGGVHTVQTLRSRKTS